MQEHSITRFIGIPDHKPSDFYFLDESGQSTQDDERVKEVVVELTRVNRSFRCPCGRTFITYYDVTDRFVRDLPWGPWKKVSLLVPRFRVDCPECGVTTEQLDWITPRRRHTKRLADAVAWACREERSVQGVADQFDLGWDLVKDIDKEALKQRLDPPDLSGIRHVAVDEFSVTRRHHYATIFLDTDRNRIAWICAGHDKQAVVDVFENVFGREVCESIEAVSMDWWRPYEEAVRQCLPNAEIVWDFFHVVKLYNHKVIDRVRVDEANRCQTQEERRLMKGTKFLLLKNRDNLIDDEPARLKALLNANKRLLIAYVLGDALKKLWEYTSAAKARRWFEGWFNRAIRSRIEPVKAFAHALQQRIEGVIAHCRHNISTGPSEGVNNKVKVIKRIAYGFRDQEYFFYKLRGHFTGY